VSGGPSALAAYVEYIRSFLRPIVMSLREHNPGGALVFLFVGVAGALGALLGDEVTLSEYLAAVATAGGLLGVGHSVHRGAKHVGSLRAEDDHRVTNSDAGEPTS